MLTHLAHEGDIIELKMVRGSGTSKAVGQDLPFNPVQAISVISVIEIASWVQHGATVLEALHAVSAPSLSPLSVRILSS